MDGNALLHATKALVETASPSGEEGPALEVAEELLSGCGLIVERQEVEGPSRFNLLAFHGRPQAVLVTHIDTVPDELPVYIEGDSLFGRGACDAKGVLAAMMGAASRLRARDRSDFGLIVVVGEETTSDGAMRANQAFAEGDLDWPLRRVLVGEPTGNRYVSAHPGVLILEVRAEGRPAHSAYPEEGRSAVLPLLDFLEVARKEPWSEDPLLGPTRMNIGTIEAGTAPNVVAQAARAEIMFRSGEDPARIQGRLRELAGEDLDIRVVCTSPPVHFRVPGDQEGEAKPVSFSTDAPFLTHMGDRYLLGPGSIRHAHTDEERITRMELEEARDLYVAWVEECLDG